ncbi:hypothetical protein LINPERPRIM_LOCUS35857 [Linum perenne]
MMIAIIATMTLMRGDVGLIRSVGAVDPPPICGASMVNETYMNDMTKLLSELQLSAPHGISNLQATYKEGSVAGIATCGGSQCSECLSVAQIKLIVYCKGRESGATSNFDGHGVCQMSGKEVSHPYDSDVGKLVFQLQQLAPRNSATWAATLTVGHVTGAASCDWDITYNDCLTCLGWAATDLSVDCKGRESGSSKGLGGCDMSFKPAY